MDSQIDFEQVEETALRFALMMGKEDLNSMLDLSNSAMCLAIEWHELQQTRLGLFYANPESRKDWIKASGSKLSVSDLKGSRLKKETSYWIIPVGEEFPIFTKLISFDGPDAEFETLDKKGSYYAKEILVDNQPAQHTGVTDDETPAPIPKMNSHWQS